MATPVSVRVPLTDFMNMIDDKIEAILSFLIFVFDKKKN